MLYEHCFSSLGISVGNTCTRRLQIKTPAIETFTRKPAIDMLFVNDASQIRLRINGILSAPLDLQFKTYTRRCI